MKKTLLSLALLLGFGFVQGQNLMTENFDVAPPVTWLGGLDQNHSDYPSPYTWHQGDSGIFNSQSGEPNSYMLVDYSCAAGNGTISNWIITPSVSLQNGDIISFYTRTYSNPAQYKDRLELRIAQGTTPAEPTDSNGVGDYTTLALSVNPDLTSTDYPNVWTKYSYTVTGISSSTPCKIAFRYYVTNGGSQGTNSDIIGIDTFSIDRALGTDDFFANNFSIAPNPANAFFNLTAKNGESIQNIKVIDINGRIVNEMTTSDLNEVQVNVSNLNAGVYFVKVQSESGVGTSKIIKK